MKYTECINWGLLLPTFSQMSKKKWLVLGEGKNKWGKI